MIDTVYEDIADLSTNSGLGVLWTTVNDDVRPRVVSLVGVTVSTSPQHLHTMPWYDPACRCNEVAPSSTYSMSKTNVTV